MRSDEIGPFLQAAEQLLRDKVVTAASGDARFAGLMIASALGMASRDIALRDRLDAAAREVTATAAQIRGGGIDADAELYRQLLLQAALRTAVTRPQALRPAEKALAGLP